MSRQHYLTWEQAIKAVQQGKRLLFYHCGKAVPKEVELFWNLAAFIKMERKKKRA